MKIDPNFQTPIPVCEYMVSLIPKHSQSILEPTPGLGNLVITLEMCGFDVDAANDFFLIDRSTRYDCIVMNPPFSHLHAVMDNAPESLKKSRVRVGDYMLSECMKMSDNIIALMPWLTIINSDNRLRDFKSFGLKSLTHLPRKTFPSARTQTAIIELEKGFPGITIFKTFNF